MMRVHRTTVGDIDVAEVEIPEMMNIENGDADFGMHRFTDGVRSERRRSEIIVTRLLVKDLFGDNAVLCHEDSGAPYVEVDGRRLPMGFSLSHCRGWVVAAWSETESVGIDVELIEPRIDRVKERVLCHDELRFVGRSLWKAAVAWTAKEAVFKCAGEQGVDFQRDIALDLSTLHDGDRADRYRASAFGRTFDVHSFTTDNRIITVTSTKHK